MPSILCLHAKPGKEQFCVSVQCSTSFPSLISQFKISQRTELDFVLKEEYALESNVLTDVHPGCLFLLLGPPALLITESLSSVPSLGV